MGITYSAHGRDEKLLYFGFDTLREVAIRGDIRRTHGDITKRGSRQACEIEKTHVITLAGTGFGVQPPRTRRETIGSSKMREIS